MITQLRTVNIASGKLTGAFAWAREIAEYAKAKGGLNIKLLIPVGGNPNRVCWLAEYSSLAAMEQAMQKMMSDPKYMEMYAKAADYVISGTSHDDFWTTF